MKETKLIADLTGDNPNSLRETENWPVYAEVDGKLYAIYEIDWNYHNQRTVLHTERPPIASFR